MNRFFNAFAADESGATAIEYGLIAAMIAMGIIVSAGNMGDSLSENFNNTASALEPE